MSNDLWRISEGKRRGPQTLAAAVNINVFRVKGRKVAGEFAFLYIL